MSFKQYKMSILHQFYRMTPAVKILVIAHITMYVVGILATLAGQGALLINLLALTPLAITRHFAAWQLVTATFVYTPRDIIDLFFNVMVLAGIGSELEWLWGKYRFLVIYLVMGLLANLFFFLLLPTYPFPVLATAGALSGILAAFATRYPQQQIFFFGYPMKVKVLVLFFAGLMFVLSFGQPVYTISLAGFFFGFAYIKFDKHFGRDLQFWVKEQLRLWRIRRKYRNFRVVDNDVKKLWDDLEDRINKDDHNSRIN